MKSIICHLLMIVTILSTSFIGNSEVSGDDPKLTWSKIKLSVLVVKKINDTEVSDVFVDVIEWLIKEKKMKVFVEKAVTSETKLITNSKFSKVQQKLSYFQNGNDDKKYKIDFIICLGGDGTLLYTSSLFQETVPPIMPFHLGSLSFLAPFKIKKFKQEITKVLEGHATLFHRNRITCKLIKKENNFVEHPLSYSVLNDVVVQRESSSLTNLDVFYDGDYVTNVQADGLIISTATGSTAYAASSGASLLYPSVQAILISAICPHTLTYRSIILPLDAELKITLHSSSRGNASVVFDNRNKQEFSLGDSLHITQSVYPVPTINSENQITDWFSSLTQTLNWNVDPRQNY